MSNRNLHNGNDDPHHFHAPPGRLDHHHDVHHDPDAGSTGPKVAFFLHYCKLQDTDHVVGLMTLTALNCPALRSQEGAETSW